MRTLGVVLAVVLLAWALAACGDDPPPTQIYIVVTSTPLPAMTGTPTDEPTADASPAPIVTAVSTARATATSGGGALAGPTNAPLAIATPLPAQFPTNVVAQVQLAEQVFDQGRMFWIRHSREIWVMVASPDDPNSGDWYCYHDNFEEGEPEIDPNLIPPDGHYQPRRGFGKLWRSHPELREALGWALTPEFEMTSGYAYLAGGRVEQGQYVPGLGEHRLNTLYNDSISFFERDIRGECRGGTWRLTTSQ